MHRPTSAELRASSTKKTRRRAPTAKAKKVAVRDAESGLGVLPAAKTAYIEIFLVRYGAWGFGLYDARRRPIVLSSATFPSSALAIAAARHFKVDTWNASIVLPVKKK